MTVQTDFELNSRGVVRFYQVGCLLVSLANFESIHVTAHARTEQYLLYSFLLNKNWELVHYYFSSTSHIGLCDDVCALLICCGAPADDRRNNVHAFGKPDRTSMLKSFAFFHQGTIINRWICPDRLNLHSRGLPFCRSSMTKIQLRKMLESSARVETHFRSMWVLCSLRDIFMPSRS